MFTEMQMSGRRSLKEASGANPAWLAVPLVLVALITLTVGLAAGQGSHGPSAIHFFSLFLTHTLPKQALLETVVVLRAGGQSLTSAPSARRFALRSSGRHYQSDVGWCGRA